MSKLSEEVLDYVNNCYDANFFEDSEENLCILYCHYIMSGLPTDDPGLKKLEVLKDFILWARKHEQEALTCKRVGGTSFEERRNAYMEKVGILPTNP